MSNEKNGNKTKTLLPEVEKARKEIEKRNGGKPKFVDTEPSYDSFIKKNGAKKGKK